MLNSQALLCHCNDPSHIHLSCLMARLALGSEPKLGHTGKSRHTLLSATLNDLMLPIDLLFYTT